MKAAATTLSANYNMGYTRVSEITAKRNLPESVLFHSVNRFLFDPDVVANNYDIVDIDHAYGKGDAFCDALIERGYHADILDSLFSRQS